MWKSFDLPFFCFRVHAYDRRELPPWFALFVTIHENTDPVPSADIGWSGNSVFELDSDTREQVRMITIKHLVERARK